MDRFLTKPKNGEPSSSDSWSSMSLQIALEVQRERNPSLLSNVDKVLDLKFFEPDPKERMPISDYSPNIRDEVLLFTNELNKALQKKDQDIVNVMGMLDLAKKRLQMTREIEWNSLLDEVCSFYSKHDILIPKMNEDYTIGKSKRKRSKVSYLHHFHVEVFYTIIDLEFQELNDRFDVVTTDLLLGMSSLSLVDSFANFDKDRIMKLAEYCPSEFGDNKLREIGF
ncbi:uncharacterized protein [Nicotiana sylvestris]|uniref:Uncharacterized protein LOC104248656 n=1 Tax=Nicotiana sylvestris TaxID=4096 RepID=A0A1U7YWZ2_NICSY|nr:PREDICTED: uncharacterized protein LOC104248656 [Nicotiana sylvestris]